MLPAAFGLARYGWAKMRGFMTTWLLVGAGALCADARCFLATVSWRPALAGAVGLASASECAETAREPFTRSSTFGTGYTRETEPSPLYVYWLPYTSCSTR